MGIDGKRLGLALSGGGFRAALFGLGSLWRLNDAGLLQHLDRVTSVSGGSITAGLLACRWRKLTFDNGGAVNFDTEIATPLQTFCSRTIDVTAGLIGMANPFKSAGQYLAKSYEDLFGRTLMRELPVAAEGHPKFTFYATNLQTGRSFRFRQDMLADYLLGVCKSHDVRLTTAVAASSAFPPIFSPVVIETDPNLWADGSDTPNLTELRRRIVLADGGVYDNMGLESLIDNVDISLVSDAGAPFDIEEDPASNYLSQLGRVRDILIDQTRALRKRWLVEEFEAKRKRGAYWGIGTKVADYRDEQCAFKDTQITRSLAAVPTRLAAFEPEVRARLVNWGYVLCDAALRSRAELPMPAIKQLPLPQWQLH